MTALFDSAGYSSTGIWRRRLWAIALLKLLPSANGGIVTSLDQVCLASPSTGCASKFHDLRWYSRELHDLS